MKIISYEYSFNIEGFDISVVERDQLFMNDLINTATFVAYAYNIQFRLVVWATHEGIELNLVSNL